MAFSSTITFTINSVAKVLSKVNQDGYSSEWLLLEATGQYRLLIRNTKRMVGAQEMHRHNAELTYTVYATGGNPEQVRKYFWTAEFPKETDLAQAKLEQTGFVNGLAGIVTNGIFEWMS